MSRITKPVPAATREYRSELRARQAEETRSRILDATARVMARGIATVSIPAVAREAHVSIPTIYRHFGTKEDLLAAVYPYLERRAGLGTFVPPMSIEQLRGGILALLGNLDALDDLARAAMASPAAAEARQVMMPSRLKMTLRVADSIVPKLDDADRDRIARLLAILTTSAALRTWRDALGLSADEVADDVDWIVQSAARGAGIRSDR
jgi:AcrR family transcriptional regulator